MRRLSTLVLALVVLASSATFAGCKKSDSVLLVEVSGDVQAIVPYQFNVTVRAGLDTHAIRVPMELDPANPITLPTSFTISLDRSYTGPVFIAIDAVDERGIGSTIAFGSTKMDHIVVGGQTIISVMLRLNSEPTTPDDGGADDSGIPLREGGAGETGAGGQEGGPADAAEAGASDVVQDAQDAQDTKDAMGLDLGTD